MAGNFVLIAPVVIFNSDSVWYSLIETITGAAFMGLFTRYFFTLTVAQRADLARRCNTSPMYLYLIATGRKRPSGDLSIDIARESGLPDLLTEFRPEADWGYVRRLDAAAMVMPRGKSA